MMRLPGLQAMWLETRPMYSSKFAQFMDDAVMRASVETDVDELARWATTVGSVRNKDAL
jgi:hypothetical protein